MGACAEDEPVLVLLVRIAIDPSLGVEHIWIRICFRIVEGGVGGRNYYRVCGELAGCFE